MPLKEPSMVPLTRDRVKKGLVNWLGVLDFILQVIKRDLMFDHLLCTIHLTYVISFKPLRNCAKSAHSPFAHTVLAN